MAKRKTELGENINLVRETMKEKKIDDELGQVGFEKMFRPITKRLPVPSGLVSPQRREPSIQDLYAGLQDFLEDDFGQDIFKVFDEDEKDAKDDRGQYDLLPEDAKDEEDDGDEFFSLLPEGSPVPPQQQKQMPASPSSYDAASFTPPPRYTDSQYYDTKRKEAEEEKRVVEELGLPRSYEIGEQSLKAYDEMVKKLGYRGRELKKKLTKPLILMKKRQLGNKSKK